MINQLAGKLNFLVRNLIQRINFGVVHDGHVEAVIHCLVHEHAVQDPAGIGV